MKKFFFVCFALLLLLPFDDAVADTSATFTATATVLYEDGSAIPASDPISYFLYCGTTQGNYNIALNVTTDLVNGGENVNVSLCVPSPGTYYFVATAYSFTHQTESVYSNEVSKIFIAADFEHIPMAPTILAISP